MTLAEILGLSGSGVAIVILGLIKVKPLDISVWSWLARKLGRAFNSEMYDEISDVKKTLKAHLAEHEQAKADRDEDRAETNRQRILRFSDEMYMNVYHSKESFDDILEKIDQYNSYCMEHPEFQNGRTITAAAVIKEQYKECLVKHSFEAQTRKEATDV